MRGRLMSSANFVAPTHFERASTLRKGRPTTLISFESAALAPPDFEPLPLLFVAMKTLSSPPLFFISPTQLLRPALRAVEDERELRARLNLFARAGVLSHVHDAAAVDHDVSEGEASPLRREVVGLEHDEPV